MKTILLLACLLGVTSLAQAQTISLTINAGVLENGTGSAVEPNGGLLELIASPSGIFSAPTSSSYLTGDNVLVSSFAMNSNSGTAGLTVNALNSIPVSGSGYTLSTGEALELRFYPGLTYASAPASPTLGTSFGQVRSSSIEFGSPKDPTETAWVVPSPGSASVDLDYVTISGGGTYSNASAFATGIVVPEPSSIISSMVGAVMMGSYLLRRVRRA